MKFCVDAEVCIGCGSCVGICPAVFQLAGGVSVVQQDEVEEDLWADALMAEDCCPVMAISHLE